MQHRLVGRATSLLTAFALLSSLASGQTPETSSPVPEATGPAPLALSLAERTSHPGLPLRLEVTMVHPLTVDSGRLELQVLRDGVPYTRILDPAEVSSNKMTIEVGPTPAGSGRLTLQAELRRAGESGAPLATGTQVVRFDQTEGGLVVLHLNVKPYVHSWIAQKAAEMLDGADPVEKAITAELAPATKGSYLWGGLQQDAFSPTMIYPGHYPEPPGTWDDQEHLGSSVFEGTWEEDDDAEDGYWAGLDWVCAPLNACHFWEPDGGWNNGNYLGNSALYAADYWWDLAASTYPSNRALAYYYLGRVVHLMGDMAIPEHVHNDDHAGRYRPLSPSLDHSNFEYSAGFDYRSFTGGGKTPKELASLSLTVPVGYIDDPGIDPDLARYFYNMAQFTQHLDSSDSDGNDDGPGGTTIAMTGIEVDNPHVRQEYGGAAWVNTEMYMDPTSPIAASWGTGCNESLQCAQWTTVPECPAGSPTCFDAARAYGLVLLTPTLADAMASSDVLHVTFNYCPSSPCVGSAVSIKRSEFDGSPWVVPDRSVKGSEGQQAKVFDESISYVAGLYKLFFDQTQFVLSLTKAGTGSGTVSSTPSGVDCGVVCTIGFVKNSTVTLTALAAAGSTFVGWSGVPGCTGTGPCTVTMDQARSVTATFAAVTPVLTVSKAGSGAGTVTSTPAGISCGGTCAAAFPYSTSVGLAAVAGGGSTFAGWGGACSGAGSCVVTMSQARSVTATFSGGGTVTASGTPNPVNVDLPSTINVTVRDTDGSTPPVGTAVTYATGFPGNFSGGSCGGVCYSPHTGYTDSSGATWVRFTGSASGTANLTISALGGSTLLPLEIVDPSGGYQVTLSIGFLSGTTSESTYRLNAAVTDSGGAPVSGERVDFTTTRGTLSADHDFSGTGGHADVNLTVYESGPTTCTATAAGHTAAVSFNAVIGSAGAAMCPARLFTVAGDVFGLEFAPDGSALYAASEMGDLRAWYTSDWSQKWSQDSDNSGCGQLSVRSDGLRFLVSGDDVQIRYASDGTLSCEAPPLDWWAPYVQYLTTSSYFVTDYDILYKVSSACGSSVAVYTLPTGETFEDDGRLSFSAASGLAAACSDEGYLYVWNTSGGLLRREDISSGLNCFDTAFSSDGSKLAAVGSSGSVRVFNTSTWSSQTYATPALGGDRVATTFLDNDTKLAVGGQAKLEIVDVAGGASLRTADLVGDATEMSWNATTGDLAVGTNQGRIYVFRALEPGDVEGPMISVAEPADGLVTRNGSVHIAGLVTDASQMTSFTIGGTAVAVGADGSFSYDVALVEGSNAIAFAASDTCGNSSNVTRTVTLVLDRVAPVVSGFSVSPGSGVPGALFTVQCSVVDGDTGVGSVTADVQGPGGGTVASLPMSPAGGSLYQATFDSTGRGAGAYTIDIEAVDSSPQANTESFTGAGSFTLALPGPLTEAAGRADFAGLPGTSSNINGVLDPGETAAFAPGWSNPGDVNIFGAGVVSSFSGPGSVAYTTPDTLGTIGLVGPGDTGNCFDGSGDCYALAVGVPATRPSQHWDASITETLNSGQSTVWTLHIGGSFADMSMTSGMYRYVETIFHNGVTTGFAGGLYRPTAQVSRAQMAMFIARAMAGDDASVPPAHSNPANGRAYDCTTSNLYFTDVSPSASYCRHVHYLWALEVVAGCSSSPARYCPTGSVSRAQMAIFMARAVAGGDSLVPSSYTDPDTARAYTCGSTSPSLYFTDVSATSSSCKYAHYLWARAVIDGCSSSPARYCPASLVRRDQMAKFLTNGFGLQLCHL